MPPVDPKVSEVKDPPKDPPKEKSKPEGKPMPLSIEDVIGSAQEQVVRNWNHQAKQGIIFQCKEGHCYYPLVPVRDANNQPVVFNHTLRGKGGKELIKTEFVMTCTYHPEHGESITLPRNSVILKEGQRITSVVGFKVAVHKKDDDLEMT